MRLIFGIFLLCNLATAGLSQELTRSISVSGTGAVSLVPDLARVALGVQTNARTARDALAQNSRAMEVVIAVLKRNDIEDRDYQTSQISLYPEWHREGTRATVVGYNAQNQLTITVRDLDGVGALLDALSDAGANNFQSITFDVADTSEAQNEARRRAVLDARARAELYATAAGVTLGEVLSISETGTSRPQPMPMGRAQLEMPSSVPIAAGEMSISAQIHIIYAIAQ